MEQCRYIKIDNCINYIKNGCLSFLSNSIEDIKSKDNNIDIYKMVEPQLDVSIEYAINDELIESLNINAIELKKINRVTINKDDEIKLVFLIYFKFENNLTDNYVVRYQNLLNEKKELTFSKEYILKVKDTLKAGLKEVANSDCDYILHINNSCEFCNSYEECKAKIIKENRVEKISLLSFEDIEYLHRRIPPIITINQLNNQFPLLENETEGFKDKKNDVQKWIKEDKNIALYDKYFLDWNDYDKNAAYIVTFQGHSKTDVVYAFAYRKMYSKDKANYIILDEKPNSKEQVLEHYKAIIDSIYSLINYEHQSKKDVIFYILAPYEKKNFEKIVETILDQQSYYAEDFRNKVLIIAEYFGMPYYTHNDFEKYVNAFVDTLVDIKSLIEKHLHLGINIKYSFTDVYNKLYIASISKSNSYELSWALKPQYIERFWNKNDGKLQLEKQLDIMLSNAYKLKKALFDKLKNGNKIVYPQKRIFSNNNNFLDRFLMKETVDSIKEYKQQFADFTMERLFEKGLVLKIEELIKKKEDKDNYNKKHYHYEFQYNVNSDFDNDGIIEYFTENDFEDFIKRKFSFENSLEKLDLKELSLVTGKKIEKETIYITKGEYSTIEDKKTIINNQEKLFLNLETNKINKFEEIIKYEVPNFKFEEIKKFSNSQQEVFKHVCQNKLTLLWGPPGTGKTYCIGKIVDGLVKQNKDIKILVIGFTHLSIENCLKKIKKIDGQNRDTRVVKWNEVKDKECGKLGIKAIKDVNEKFQIIGATVYNIDKFSNIIFDMIIIDEASQMKIPEFLMTLKVANKKTKFFIVGDNRQLAPIIKNKYLDINRKKIPLSDSIFDYLYQSKYKKDILVQLEECYRMNEIICDYLSKKLYNGKLKSVKNEKLPFNITGEDEYSKILNPDYPVVLCLINNHGKKMNYSDTEAGLVAELSKTLSDLYPVGDDFWGNHLAVVSPHHSQIKLIKNKLGIKFDCSGEDRKSFFVETVDKMQGQESDTVIVSYGVTDPQIAVKEKEFIYNLNRLNVSITRAKKKLIVIISKELLNIDYHIVDENDLKEHIDFMQSYINSIKDKKISIFSNSDYECFGMPFDSYC